MALGRQSKANIRLNFYLSSDCGDWSQTHEKVSTIIRMCKIVLLYKISFIDTIIAVMEFPKNFILHVLKNFAVKTLLQIIALFRAAFCSRILLG